MGDALALNLAANALWAIIVWLGRRFLRRLDVRDPRRRRSVLLGTSLTIVLILLGALYLLTDLVHVDQAWGWALVVGAVVWMILMVVFELQRFWRVGLLGADGRVAQGLSYGPALRLVRTTLSFLGTGAHKLTSDGEFESAIRRCRSDEAVRFLLRRPDDPTLEAAAKRAGKSSDLYKRRVIESLRRIAQLQTSVGNLEVRFYEGDLVFRIMLIDRRIALVSYNVYGHGDGSELPQLHFVDVSERRDTAASFYHAYERYFNERWDEATPWDMTEFL